MAEFESPHVSSNQSDESDDTQRGFGAIVRIYWTLITNLTLGILAIGISNRHSGLDSLDAFYLITVVLLIAVRYCDIKYFAGPSDKPATMADWRKYVLLLLLITGGMWLAAHGLSLLRK
jgi:hypothetical protein